MLTRAKMLQTSIIIKNILHHGSTVHYGW
uniref:Uncharacterized protein n=1 Tax=Rhizophora mucronata TaxID=61149 RepID=A0A2P2N8K1_RHIMU